MNHCDLKELQSILQLIQKRLLALEKELKCLKDDFELATQSDGSTTEELENSLEECEEDTTNENMD